MDIVRVRTTVRPHASVTFAGAAVKGCAYPRASGGVDSGFLTLLIEWPGDEVARCYWKSLAEFALELAQA